MYQYLSFKSNANAFVRLQLSIRSTFWQLLCDLPIEMGRVSGFLPPTASYRKLLHFAWHLHSREDLEQDLVDYDYRRKEREILANFLKSSNNLIIFYGDTVPPGGTPRVYDGAFQGTVTTYFHTLSYPNNYSNEVPTRTETYYVVQAGASMNGLELALENAIERQPFMAALTSLPVNYPGLPADKELTDNLLKLLTSRTETIFVSAYEGDANLIWTRI